MKLKLVTATRNDRLGSVLINMFQAWSFAQRLELPFECTWPLQHPKRGLYSFREVIDWSQVTPPFEIHEGLHKVPQNALILNDTPGLGGSGPFDPGLLPDHIDTLHYILVRPVLVGADNQAEAVALARKLAHTISFNDAVRAALDELDAEIGLSKHVSVHLRRGDIVSDLVKADAMQKDRARFIGSFVARYVDIDAYLRAVDDRARDADLLVFSEDVASIEEFRRRAYPRRVRTPDSFAKYGLTLLQHALADMLTMSRTRAIFGSKSEFTNFAALYGGNKIVLTRAYIHPTSMEKELRERFAGVADVDTLVSDLLSGFAEMMSVVAPLGPSAIDR